MTGEGHFPLVLALALIGVVWALWDRRTLILPVWWVTILVLDARAGFTYAMAPVSMLAGLGAVNVLWPLVAPRMRRDRWWVARRMALAGFAIVVAMAMVAAASTRFNRTADTQVLTALTRADRDAMRWVATHTDSSARFLVLTETSWQIDKISEWFPVLAERVSVGTVQGTEWLPGGEFQRSIMRQSRIRGCAAREPGCLESLHESPALVFTHVYVPRTCCSPLLAALRRDARYQPIYTGQGATIFARGELVATSR
jgi:hypothetical protein